MVMPEGVSGLELCTRLRAMKAGIRTLITSGYSAEILKDDLLAAPNVTFLPKPYDVPALAAAVRECLDSKA